MSNAIAYQLPNREVVHIQYELCRAASFITFTMKGGQVVLAVIVPGQEAVITAAYREFRYR